MLCHYHSSVGGCDPKWTATADFASREFRAASPKVISQLIGKCKESSKRVCHLSWSYRKDAKINGGRKPKAGKRRVGK